jgi:hypothetical protein
MKAAKPRSVAKPRLASQADRDAAAQYVRDYMAYVHDRDDVGGDRSRQIDGDDLAAFLGCLAQTGTFNPGDSLLRHGRRARVLALYRRAKAGGANMLEWKEWMAGWEGVDVQTIRDDISPRKRKV